MQFQQPLDVDEDELTLPILIDNIICQPEQNHSDKIVTSNFDHERDVYAKLKELKLPFVCGRILQRGEASLDDYVRKRLKEKNPLTESEILAISYRLLSAIGILYQNGIIHGNIKPQNIIVFPGAIKLGDFGCSILIEKNEKRIPLARMIGFTRMYAADIVRNIQSREWAEMVLYDPLQADLFSSALTILNIMGIQNLEEMRNAGNKIRKILTQFKFRNEEALSEILGDMLESRINAKRLSKNIIPRFKELFDRSKLDFIPYYSDQFYVWGQRDLQRQEVERSLNYYEDPRSSENGF